MFYLITTDKIKEKQVQMFGMLVGIVSYIQSQVFNKESFECPLEDYIVKCFMTTKRNDIVHLDITYECSMKQFNINIPLKSYGEYVVRITKENFDAVVEPDAPDFGYNGVGYVDRILRDIWEYGFIVEEEDDE